MTWLTALTPEAVLARACVHVPSGEAKVCRVLRSFQGCFLAVYAGHWQVGTVAQPVQRLLSCPRQQLTLEAILAGSTAAQCCPRRLVSTLGVRGGLPTHMLALVCIPPSPQRGFEPNWIVHDRRTLVANRYWNSWSFRSFSWPDLPARKGSSEGAYRTVVCPGAPSLCVGRRTANYEKVSSAASDCCGEWEQSSNPPGEYLC